MRSCLACQMSNLYYLSLVMYGVRPVCSAFVKFTYFRQIRFLHKNHYEILNLNRNCSSDDIRKSFIELSKKHHPDKTQSENSHSKYVEILDAYKVLSNPKTRIDYDLSLGNQSSRSTVQTNHPNYYEYYYDPRREYYDPRRDPWAQYQQYQYNFNNNFERGHRRHGNKSEIIRSMFISLSLLIIIYSMTLWFFFYQHHERARNAYVSNAELLREVREKADEHGNTKQIEFMVTKMNDKK